MPFKSFSLHALVSLSWWLLVWMSQCQYGCVWLSLCAPNNHACKSACPCFDHITHPLKMINLRKLLLAKLPVAPTVTVHELVFTVITVTDNKCTFCGRNHDVIGEALHTHWRCDCTICVLNEVYRHSPRPSHFTGGTFGLFPSAGGTSSESRTVVSLPAVWMAGTCCPHNL